MLHISFDDSAQLALIRALRGPAAAALVVALAALAGRRVPALRRAAIGLGLAAGWWILLAGVGLRQPAGAPARLTGVALVAACLAALAPVLPRRLRINLPILAGAVAGWWLASGPTFGPDIWRALPTIFAVAASAWVAARVLGSTDPPGVAAVALTFGVALAWLGARVPFPAAVGVAAATAVAAAFFVALPRLPLAVGLVGVAAAIELAPARGVRCGFDAIDLACAVPFLVPAVAARLSHRPGAMRRVAALLITSLLCVGALIAADRIAAAR